MIGEKRTAAANAAAVIAARAGGLDDALALQAISMMLRPRDRGYAWYSLSREALKETDLANVDDRQLAAKAREALGRRGLQEAMRLTFAISPAEKSSRNRLLTSILDAASQAADYAVAQRVSLAFTDKDDQEEAVRVTIGQMIDSGEPLRALSAIDRLFIGPAKADAFRELAVDLDKAGYTQVADDAFERAVSGRQRTPRRNSQRGESSR